MRRVLVDGCQRWTVDHRLRAAFRVQEGDEVIRIPTDFLRHARCRYGGLLYMAAAAWAEGELDKKWIRRADETTLRLRVPITEIRRVLGFEGAASDMGRTALAPAVEEINRLTDYHLDAVLVRAPSRRGIGKVVAVDILMGLPVLVEPKPRKPKAKPAVEVLPDNVIRLPQPRRITRRPVPDEQIDF